MTGRRSLEGADGGEIAARVELFEHRVLEEFYDFGKDPDGLNNLIDSPDHQEEIGLLCISLTDQCFTRLAPGGRCSFVRNAG